MTQIKKLKRDVYKYALSFGYQLETLTMISVNINNRSYYVQQDTSILEACKLIGIIIPRFCYHESLSIAGNCRMCLVEIENLSKPAASCLTLVAEDLSIFLNTPVVKKARENIIEFLLLNHPLDCPICDQGGECDLQDQVKVFGSSYSRFFFPKRVVENKNVGPLIKTIMTRCIHCTRCVRFGSEVAGVEKLGTLGRGKNTEIGSYVKKFFSSEISGNVIDLCPVGALTSKPYAFQSRPWELKSVESIDLTDGLGSNIYINFKGSEIFRVLPKNNINLNASIISDRIRFSYDSLKKQRINNFSLKEFDKKSSAFIQKKVDYKVILEQIKSKIKANILIIINEELSVETLLALKLCLKKKNRIAVRKLQRSNNTSNYYNNPFNSVKELLQKSIRNCFLISCNIRLENTILNSKIRIKSLTEQTFVYGFNNKFKSVFPIKFINFNILSVLNFISGKKSLLSSLLYCFHNPLILLNSSFFIFENVALLKNLFFKINSSSILFDIKLFSNSLGTDLLNFKKLNTKDFMKSNIISFCVGLEDNILLRKNIVKKSNQKVVWLNSYKSELAFKSNLIIPIESDFEKKGGFINLEGRSQKSLKVIKNIRIQAIDALLESIFKSHKKNVFTKQPRFINSEFENVKTGCLFDSLRILFLKKLDWKGNYSFFYNYSFKSFNEDFYLVNNFTKNSSTMSQCSRYLRKNSTNF
jgi:NADH-quinone oxidoreductase chain G